jgi:hypothetical protein
MSGEGVAAAERLVLDAVAAANLGLGDVRGTFMDGPRERIGDFRMRRGFTGDDRIGEIYGWPWRADGGFSTGDLG